ncbi:hypothetical protein DFJ73DRAFT_51486 [Zopfochytrium polystomum]|nr:hypothetical protein DFJ73DRAFT_51486 [Zopfochytrium polystomum]
MPSFVVLSSTNAFMLSILSISGCVFLLIIGALIHGNNSMVAGGKHAIEDPKAVGRQCFFASLIYGVLFVFATLQSYLIKKQTANDQTFSQI